MWGLATKDTPHDLSVEIFVSLYTVHVSGGDWTLYSVLTVAEHDKMKISNTNIQLFLHQTQFTLSPCPLHHPNPLQTTLAQVWSLSQIEVC